jgi:hypothetical protein
VILLAFSLAAAAAVAPASEAPAAAEVAISGRTTADPKVAHEALGEVGGFAGRALKCSQIDGVEASPLPAGWVPTDPNFRIGPAGARYERWEVSLCGRREPFLIVFWSDAGGPQFQVGHPFPAGPAAPKP